MSFKLFCRSSVIIFPIGQLLDICVLLSIDYFLYSLDFLKSYIGATTERECYSVMMIKHLFYILLFQVVLRKPKKKINSNGQINCELFSHLELFKSKPSDAKSCCLFVIRCRCSNLTNCLKSYVLPLTLFYCVLCMTGLRNSKSCL